MTLVKTSTNLDFKTKLNITGLFFYKLHQT